MRHCLGSVFFAALLLFACGGENLLEEMHKVVPLYKGANVVDKRSVAERQESIIQFDLEASQASEDDVIEFYKQSMTEKGWAFEEIERFPGNGSVFSMVNNDVGKLTIQTITRNTKTTGKIRVVLNLTKS